jgi:hypothetical protein
MPRKQFLRHLCGTAGVIAVVTLVVACGGGDAEAPLSFGAASARSAAPVAAESDPTLDELSSDEIDGLKFMREEEKLAHDVYVAMSALWAHRTFDNIAQSETEHTEAVLAMLTKYGIEDPAANKPAGLFENPDLQAMYDALVTTGRASLVAGLKVGALIEETDIRDIEGMKAVTDEADILRVYDSLLCGSRNHLRAFNNALLGQGVVYVSQVVQQQEWDAIAQSPSETCGP